MDLPDIGQTLSLDQFNALGQPPPSQVVSSYLNPDGTAGVSFIDAIIHQESHNNPNAVSPVGAQGLMQLMPATAASLGVTDPFDPEQNVAAGTKYINQQLHTFGTPELALAAYNYGPGNVKKLQAKYGDAFSDIYPHLPKETKNYVTSIMGNLQKEAPPTKAMASSEMPEVGQTISLEQFAAIPDASSPSARFSNVISNAVTQPTPIGPDKDSTAYKIGQFERNVYGNAYRDIKAATLEAAANVANWGKLHDTVSAQPMTPEQFSAAQLMGVISKEAPYQGLNALTSFPYTSDASNRGLSWKPGLGWTVGPTLQIPLDQQDKLVKEYSKKFGGDLGQFQQRAQETFDPSKKTFDLNAALLQTHASFLQALTNPAYRRTVLQDNINMVVKAQDVLANPQGYTKEQLAQADSLVTYWKQKAASEGPWETAKGLMESFGKHPIGTVKSLVAGIASVPELGAVGAASDFGLGVRAVTSAKDAARFGKLAQTARGIEAAEGASPIAVTMAGAASNAADVFAAQAAKAAGQATSLARKSRVARMATGAVIGGGINAELSGLQQEQEQGFAGSQIGPFVMGAALGVLGGALHGNPLKALKAPAEAKATPSVEGVPGQEAPTPEASSAGAPSPSGPAAGPAAPPKAAQPSTVGVELPSSVQVMNRMGQPVTINPQEIAAQSKTLADSLLHPSGPAGYQKLLGIVQQMGKYRSKESLPGFVMQKIQDGVPLSRQEAREIIKAVAVNTLDTVHNVDPATYIKTVKGAAIPEEAGPGAVSGGPTGTTGGPNASKPQANVAVDKINPRTGLPISLGAPKPRFGSHQLKFEDPVDLALYITANASTKSAAHAKFLAYLARHGYTGDLLKEAQLHIKQRVKSLGMSAEDKALVTIPKNAPVEAGFLNRNKNRLAAAGIASSIGSLAASTLNQPGDSYQKKLELAAAGAIAGPLLLYTTDRFGNRTTPHFGSTEAGWIGRRGIGWSLSDEAAANKILRDAGVRPKELFTKAEPIPKELAEKIHAAYGLIRDPEGNWMKEVSDKGMHFVHTPGIFARASRESIPLNDLIQGTSFQKAYPKLASEIKVKVDLSGKIKGLWGTYSSRNKEITLYPHYAATNLGEHWLGVVSHELSHVVQQAEGWPEGAMPSTFRPQARKNLGPAATKAQLIEEARRLYSTVYGEETAELSRARRTMSQEELQANFPQFITPEGERILRHGSHYMQGAVEKTEPSLAEHLKESGDMTDEGKVPSAINIGNKLPNEMEVVARATLGDAQAITDLYRHYYPMMVNTLKGMMDARTRAKLETTIGKGAEDIAQEAFQSALRALPDFEGRSSFYTYLHSITRNKFLNAVRDANARPPTSSLYRAGTDSNDADLPLTGNVGIGSRADYGTNPNKIAGEELPSGDLTPPETLERLEQENHSAQVSDAVHEALDKIADPFRQALIDHEFNGKSFAEMAREEGVTEGAIRKRVAKAHAMFKYSMSQGHGAKFLKEGGFATPEMIQKLVKYGVVPFAGATLGMHLAEPGHKLKGALWGAIAGLMLGGTPLVAHPIETTRRIKFIMQHPNMPDMQLLTSGYQAIYHGIQREGFNTWDSVRKLVPSPERRAVLAHVLEGTSKEKLSPNERQAVHLLRTFLDRIGQTGKDAGVLKKLLPSFLNHEWLSDKGDWTRHNLHRTHETYAAGIAAGRVPKTLDVAELALIYARDMAHAIAIKHLTTGLKEFPTDLKGGMGIMPTEKAPYDYRQLDHPVLFGYRVHPALVDPLEFIYTKPYNTAVQALAVLVSSTKRLKLGLSLFHPFTLALVHLTTHPWISHGGVMEAFKEIAQSTVGKTEMQKLYRSGGYGDSFDLAMRGGLGITHPGHGDVIDADVNNGLYRGLESFEQWVKQYPLFGKTVGFGVHQFSNAYHLTDKFVWENVHTGLKLQHFMYLFDTAKMNHLRKLAKDPNYKMPTDLQLAREMAAVTNDAYGGLNWRQTVEDATTRYGRALAVALNNPSMRMVMQFSVLALDWVESTLRMFFRTFGKGSGFEGLVHPKHSADFARLYMLRNAIAVGILYNAVNMVTTGHPIWENKDPNGHPEPFAIQLGNGQSIQPNKHFFEAPDLLMDTMAPMWDPEANPFQWEMNKMGQYPKEALEQMFNKEYLGPHSPKIKNRFLHAGKMFVPISAGTFEDKGKLAALLSLFMQVSHHSKEAQYRRRHRNSAKKRAEAINAQ